MFFCFTEKKEVVFLTETSLLEVVRECKRNENWSQLIRSIGSIFNNPDSLAASFRPPTKPTDAHLSSKEELRSMEVDKDQDTSGSDVDKPPTVAAADSAATKDEQKDAPATVDDVTLTPDSLSLDLEGLRNAYKEMFSEAELPWLNALSNAIIYLSKDMDMAIKYKSAFEFDPNYVNIFQIVLEIPVLFTPELIDTCTGEFLKLFRHLPTAECVRLARYWSTFPVAWLSDLLHGLQQFIAVKCVTTEWSRDDNLLVNDDRSITGAAIAMKLIYCASVLGGTKDSPETLAAEAALEAEMRAHSNELHQRAFGYDKDRSTPRMDETMKQLSISAIDCAKPLIPFDDFINEPLSDVIEMDRDFMYYKTERADRFSFMTHSFLLTTAAKSSGLFYDNRIRMMEERRMSLVQSIMGGGMMSMPYLKLRIRRDHIIDDALVGVSNTPCKTSYLLSVFTRFYVWFSRLFVVF